MCERVALVLNVIFETQFNIYQFILKYLVKYFKYKAKWGGPSFHLDASIYILTFVFWKMKLVEWCRMNGKVEPLS